MDNFDESKRLIRLINELTAQKRLVENAARETVRVWREGQPIFFIERELQTLQFQLDELDKMRNELEEKDVHPSRGWKMEEKESLDNKSP